MEKKLPMLLKMKPTTTPRLRKLKENPNSAKKLKRKEMVKKKRKTMLSRKKLKQLRRKSPPKLKLMPDLFNLEDSMLLPTDSNEIIIH